MPTRRDIVKSGSIGVIGVLAGCINPDSEQSTKQTPVDTETDTETDTPTETPQTPQVTVTLDNQGVSAWEITDVEGSSTVGQTGTSNPEITLQTGTRYRFDNNGWSFHPLAFRDSSGTVLLSQSGDGEFEDDANVNWNDSGEFVEFTVTQELADRLNEYYCTVHSSMVGSVTVQ